MLAKIGNKGLHTARPSERLSGYYLRNAGVFSVYLLKYWRQHNEREVGKRFEIPVSV